MTELMEIYRQERPHIERELESVRDVKAAADCLTRRMEHVRMDFVSQFPDRRRRMQADRLFGAAREALHCIQAVNGAEIRVLNDSQVLRTPRDKLTAFLPTAAMAIGAVMTVWLLLEEMGGAAVLAAILTAIAWLETQVVYRRKMAVEARPRLDRYELLRWMDRLMETIQNSLTDLEQEEMEKRINDPQAVLTGDILEPVQMLLEAVQTEDGGYALKAVPRLTAALMEQGIEPVSYSCENSDYFDLFPGTEEGITIRPAILREGKLLMRGQATEKME